MQDTQFTNSRLISFSWKLVDSCLLEKNSSEFFISGISMDGYKLGMKCVKRKSTNSNYSFELVDDILQRISWVHLNEIFDLFFRLKDICKTQQIQLLIYLMGLVQDDLSKKHSFKIIHKNGCIRIVSS
jgi:hypothetical protein